MSTCYTKKDLAEAREWVRGANLSKHLGCAILDEFGIEQVAALIAKVRRRGERVAKQLRAELADMNQFGESS